VQLPTSKDTKISSWSTCRLVIFWGRLWEERVLMSSFLMWKFRIDVQEKPFLLKLSIYLHPYWSISFISSILVLNLILKNKETINFLNVTLIKNVSDGKIVFKHFCKPTYTSRIIHWLSNQPFHYKFNTAARLTFLRNV